MDPSDEPTRFGPPGPFTIRLLPGSVLDDDRDQLLWCGHCGRHCGDFAGGYGNIEGVPVCHPNAVDRPRCYELVMKSRHQLRDCPQCKVQR